MEEEEKKLNIKKIILVSLIFIFAFLIILGSALLTAKIGNKRKSQPSKAKSQTKHTAILDEKNEDNNENIIPENIVDQFQNQAVVNKTTEHHKEENINKRVPVSNPEAISLCKKAQTSNEKNIYLTFDDGPSPNVTPQVLAILKEYNVPATFFVLGSRVELYPNILKQEYNEGHYIANHGYSHQYSSIYSSVQAVIDEYNKCDMAVQTALENPNYHTLLFRFPGGSSGGTYDKLKQQAKSTLENMGIASTNWNCLNGDAEGTGRTKQQLINRLYETAAPWDSLVVLMHDADDKQTTVDALPEIIRHYQEQGYTFKNYYDIFK